MWQSQTSGPSSTSTFFHLSGERLQLRSGRLAQLCSTRLVVDVVIGLADFCRVRRCARRAAVAWRSHRFSIDCQLRSRLKRVSEDCVGALEELWLLIAGAVAPELCSTESANEARGGFSPFRSAGTVLETIIATSVGAQCCTVTAQGQCF